MVVEEDDVVVEIVTVVLVVVLLLVYEGLSWFLHYLHIFGNALLNKQQEETFKLLTLAA